MHKTTNSPTAARQRRSHRRQRADSTAHAVSSNSEAHVDNGDACALDARRVNLCSGSALSNHDGSDSWNPKAIHLRRSPTGVPDLCTTRGADSVCHRWPITLDHGELEFGFVRDTLSDPAWDVAVEVGIATSEESISEEMCDGREVSYCDFKFTQSDFDIEGETQLISIDCVCPGQTARPNIRPPRGDTAIRYQPTDHIFGYQLTGFLRCSVRCVHDGSFAL